jgi:hypothetical protein
MPSSGVSCNLVVFFVILNLVNPDFITIMYHLELSPNSYEMTEDMNFKNNHRALKGDCKGFR